MFSYNVEIEMDSSGALARLDRYLHNIRDYPNIVDEEFTKGVEAMVSLAAYYCPKLTGRLSRSIRYEGTSPNFKLIADAVNDLGQPYAAYVEFGTSRQAAQPYMWPAVNAVMEELVLLLRGRIRRFIME